MRYCVVIMAFAASFALARSAGADGGATFWVHQLVQNGQSVEIELEYLDKYGGPPFTHELSRYRGLHGANNWDFDEEVYVGTFTLTADDATEIDGPSCEGEVPPPCDWCIDCDGDGEPECPEEAFCVTYYSFTLVDECVPPDTWYYAAGLDDYDSITVTDSGDPCLGTQSDPEAGSGSGCGTLPASGRLGDGRSLFDLVVSTLPGWH